MEDIQLKRINKYLSEVDIARAGRRINLLKKVGLR